MKNKVLCKLNINTFLCKVQTNVTSKENKAAKLTKRIQPRG